MKAARSAEQPAGVAAAPMAARMCAVAAAPVGQPVDGAQLAPVAASMPWARAGEASVESLSYGQLKAAAGEGVYACHWHAMREDAGGPFCLWLDKPPALETFGRLQ